MYRASWATARESAPPRKQFLCQERAVGGLSAPGPSGSGVPSFAQAPRLRCKFLEPLPQTDSESAGWGGACAPLSQDPKGHGSHLAHTKQSLPRGPSASPKMEQKLGKGTRFRKLPPQRHERKSESERSGFAGCINA